MRTLRLCSPVTALNHHIHHPLRIPDAAAPAPAFHRRTEQQRCQTAVRPAAGKSPQYAEWSQSIPTPSSSAPVTPDPRLTTLAMTAFMFLEGAALIGAVVGGALARKRRKQLEETNLKLRLINSELRRRQAVDERESDYRTALEKSLEAPSAAHPTETYGNLKMSLAKARQSVEAAIKGAKEQLREPSGSSSGAVAVMPMLDEALRTSRDIKDPRAERAVMRLRARALRAAGDLHGSLDALRQVMELSAVVGEAGDNDADTLGEMGDVFAEMGDYDAAGKCYDRCIAAITMSSTADEQ